VTALALLSAYVGLDCARRLRIRQPASSLAWSASGALSLGTASWTMHLVGMLPVDSSISVGYDPVLLAMAWLAGVVGLIAGWHLVFSRPSGWTGLGAGTLLATVGLLGQQAVCLLAPSFQPGLEWNTSLLLATGAGTWLAMLACHGLLVVRGLNRSLAPWQRSTLSVVLLALALGISHLGVLGAAGVELQTASAHAEALRLEPLSLLASVGTPVLLLLTLITSQLDARIRANRQQLDGAPGLQNHTDPLTGLPNRVFVEDRLLAAAGRADQSKERLALLFIDLDGFKPINESYGHRFGDLLLQETSRRLRRQAGERSLVTRWTADEFLIVIEQNLDRDAVAARARAVLDALKQPFEMEGRDVPIAASIGIALYPDDGGHATLISHADAAAQAAKAAGGDTYSFFEAQMMRDVREQMELLHDLRHALDDGQLELYYQPKIHAPSGQITGAEALLRWNHPVRGLISPTVFIPIAERFGLIGSIGNWVIEEACRQIQSWREGGLRMRVAINLSVHQLRQPDLSDRIAAALATHKVNPSLLTCEITESVAMEDTDSTKAFFHRLAEVGVHISIDDFGTGYSSLSYLRQLPTEELKIDRCFVVDLETSSDARAVVDAVVKLGLALGLKVVAEGVETEGQYQVLRQLGCNEVQGFLFAKPMAAKMLYLWAVMDNGPSNLDFRPSLFGDTEVTPLDMGPG
jgi:diguanylate cyclase (GGDEF)-like protein